MKEKKRILSRNFSFNYMSFIIFLPFLFSMLQDHIYSTGIFVIFIIMECICFVFVVRSLQGIVKHEHASILALSTSLYGLLVLALQFFDLL